MVLQSYPAEAGLCNGSFGVVEEFWYAENVGPSNLPIAVMVRFPCYTGHGFCHNCEKRLPIPPKVFDWMADGNYMTRQQIPLRSRYAMTIHKSQRQTLKKVVVDLGKGEKVAHCTFVATSRVRSIDRLKGIGRNRNMIKRPEEEQRLESLAKLTKQRYSQ